MREQSFDGRSAYYLAFHPKNQVLLRGPADILDQVRSVTYRFYWVIPSIGMIPPRGGVDPIEGRGQGREAVYQLYKGYICKAIKAQVHIVTRTPVIGPEEVTLREIAVTPLTPN